MRGRIIVTVKINSTHKSIFEINRCPSYFELLQVSYTMFSFLANLHPLVQFLLVHITNNYWRVYCKNVPTWQYTLLINLDLFEKIFVQPRVFRNGLFIHFKEKFNCFG